MPSKGRSRRAASRQAQLSGRRRRRTARPRGEAAVQPQVQEVRRQARPTAATATVSAPASSLDRPGTRDHSRCGNSVTETIVPGPRAAGAVCRCTPTWALSCEESVRSRASWRLHSAVLTFVLG